MKKLMIILGLGWTIGLFTIHTTEAQHVTIININIDRQPAWGPVGYDYAEYYYIPELNIYFDVENELFYYLRGRRWIESVYLPAHYAMYDFYSLYKVVLNDIPYPWRYNRRHYRMYARYRYNYSQCPIFYMNDYRYDRARYNVCAWVEPRYMENRSYYNNVEMRNDRSIDWRSSSDYGRSSNQRISSIRRSASSRSSEARSSRSNRSTYSSRSTSYDSERRRHSGNDISTNTRSHNSRSSASSSSRSSRSTNMSTSSRRSRSGDVSSGSNRSRHSGDEYSGNTRSDNSRNSNVSSNSRSSSSRSSDARSSHSERSGRSSSRGRR